MKIGVSSYSFSRLVNEGKMAQLDVISAAKDIGYDVIEFSTLKLPEGENALDFADKIKAEAARVGIEVGNYTIGADFLNHPEGLEGQVSALYDELRVAARMGAPGMRHDATWRSSGYFDAVLPTLAQGCRAVTEYATTLGIRTMVENHGYFAQDSARVEKLINEVNHPNFGWLVDIGNFLCVDEEPARAVGIAAPYAFHVHVKDFHVKSGMLPDPGRGWFRTRAGNYLRGAVAGHGEVPVLQCLQLLKRAGYDGTVSLEFEGIEDPMLGASIGFETIRNTIAML